MKSFITRFCAALVILLCAGAAQMAYAQKLKMTVRPTPCNSLSVIRERQKELQGRYRQKRIQQVASAQADSHRFLSDGQERINEWEKANSPVVKREEPVIVAMPSNVDKRFKKLAKAIDEIQPSEMFDAQLHEGYGSKFNHSLEDKRLGVYLVSTPKLEKIQRLMWEVIKKNSTKSNDEWGHDLAYVIKNPEHINYDTYKYYVFPRYMDFEALMDVLYSKIQAAIYDITLVTDGGHELTFGIGLINNNQYGVKGGYDEHDKKFHEILNPDWSILKSSPEVWDIYKPTMQSLYDYYTGRQYVISPVPVLKFNDKMVAGIYCGHLSIDKSPSRDLYIPIPVKGHNGFSFYIYIDYTTYPLNEKQKIRINGYPQEYHHCIRWTENGPMINVRIDENDIEEKIVGVKQNGMVKQINRF